MVILVLFVSIVSSSLDTLTTFANQELSFPSS